MSLTPSTILLLAGLAVGQAYGAAPIRAGHPPVTACVKREPNYVGSVGVSAWDAAHRSAGVKVWLDPAMTLLLDGNGVSLRSRIAGRLSRWDVSGVPRLVRVVEKREQADISIIYGLTPPQPSIDGITTRDLTAGSFTTRAAIRLTTLDDLGFPGSVFTDPSPLDRITSAALHELGHALGVNGHSPSRNDLMFATGSDDTCGVGCGPSKADKNTLAYLACRAVENGTGWAVD